jgi:hypothetical protein
MMYLKKFSQFPWHAVLIGLFPILALAAYNIDQINIRVIYRPLLISLAASLLLLFSMKIIFRDWQRAGLLTTLILVLFFSYGHVYNIFHNIRIVGVLIVRNRTLAPLWLIITGLCTWYISILNHRGWLGSLSMALNIILLFLTILQIGSLLWFEYQTRHIVVNEQDFDSTYVPGDPEANSTALPDIYYIILDSYGRSDILQASYGIDNTAFISDLRDLGFYVAACSMSNYAQTQESLASTLNFNYLDDLATTFTPNHDNNAILISLVKNSATRQKLESLGYKIVAFATGFYGTEWENADFYYSPSNYWRANEFEMLFLRSSAGLIFLDSGLFNADQTNIESIRGRTLYALDTLETLPPDLSPKFVFVHLVIPHDPFVFGPNGESILIGPLFSERSYTQQEYKDGYANQVNYINSRIMEIVSKIMGGSENPPIVIIQGDHGPGRSSIQDRMSILNALYLPGKSSLLYDNISPVNTFRVIFDEYFHADYRLLEDISYFSSYDNPFDFEVIKNDCPSR